MGHLVRTLRGEKIAEELRQAYVVLAKTCLRHRAGGVADVENADFQVLQKAVLDSENLVDLSEAKKRCEPIEKDSERPGELFDQLCHMEVLLAAIPLLVAHDLRPHICAPTQQSTDGDGTSIPDLGGNDWFLEAYGGVAYGNNGKLAKDLRSLAERARTSSAYRLFLAFRPSAWYRKTPLSPDRYSLIAHRCSAKHGTPFRATAEGQMFLTSSGVAIAAVRTIALIEVGEVPTLLTMEAP